MLLFVMLLTNTNQTLHLCLHKITHALEGTFAAVGAKAVRQGPLWGPARHSAAEELEMSNPIFLTAA